jgi:histidyl-tRNA synthetase
MKFQCPPGMRDFYPEQMRVQRWLLELWRQVSRTFGFEEYEGPTFEFLDLYTVKSGEGIVSELFSFTDRGDRRFALRPEMTPTLARMVAAKASSLPRPIKWFSLPRMFRAEKPQRGRLREFYQWNVDVLGTDDVIADAEVIAVAIEFLRQVGLSPQDVLMRVSSRPVAAAVLESLGIAPENTLRAFGLLDRFDKLEPEEFRRQWSEIAPGISCEALLSRLETADLDDCLKLVRSAGPQGDEAADQFIKLWNRLADLGVQQFCCFDLKVVRGLAYYTGPVFELTARQHQLRALLGGGRYDNLTELLEGPRIPGVGFGMGDAPILELLAATGKLPDLADELDVFVIDAAEEYFPRALQIVQALRRAGLTCDFSYRRQPVSKQFSQAQKRRSRYAVVVGDELIQRNQLTLKNLRTGEQCLVSASNFLTDPAPILGPNCPRQP